MKQTRINEHDHFPGENSVVERLEGGPMIPSGDTCGNIKVEYHLAGVSIIYLFLYLSISIIHLSLPLFPLLDLRKQAVIMNPNSHRK